LDKRKKLRASNIYGYFHAERALIRDKLTAIIDGLKHGSVRDWGVEAESSGIVGSCTIYSIVVAAFIGRVEVRKNGLAV
jgi:hypothetical protein